MTYLIKYTNYQIVKTEGKYMFFSRYRERSEATKRVALARISELETSLAQARAAANCAAQEHEELRRGLQAKIDKLRYYEYNNIILVKLYSKQCRLLLFCFFLL